MAYREELLLSMENVVSDLSQIVARISNKDWHRAAGRNIHTPHAILVHLWLLDAKEFALNIHRIYDEEAPLLGLFDSSVWMKNNYRPKENPKVILQEFAALRKLEINWLRELPPAGWSRTARHLHWGVHTLQWWVELQLEYSHQHLDELSHSLNA
ncbi:MAG: hypothetical protein A2Z71_05595 [Chloroflexi bacterium RBG_13_50_21]|nr:MAG: hypothetical protein A2Z71_05595 [Chloroflexi bacterium RBG_13_50_21]